MGGEGQITTSLLSNVPLTVIDVCAINNADNFFPLSFILLNHDDTIINSRSSVHVAKAQVLRFTCFLLLYIVITRYTQVALRI